METIHGTGWQGPYTTSELDKAKDDIKVTRRVFRHKQGRFTIAKKDNGSYWIIRTDGRYERNGDTYYKP
jgi:hypothetical protein